MPDPLPIHINREEIHGLEVPTDYESTGGFDVRLINHGEPTHVHLHLDSDLSSVASLAATNHYVERETDRLVRVEVTGDGSVRGNLKVVSGYGAQTRLVDVSLVEPRETEETVEVGEDLSKPAPRPEPESGGLPGSVGTLPVMVLATVALLTALGAVAFFQNTAVVLGAAVVVVGVLIALYSLLAA